MTHFTFLELHLRRTNEKLHSVVELESVHASKTQIKPRQLLSSVKKDLFPRKTRDAPKAGTEMGARVSNY